MYTSPPPVKVGLGHSNAVVAFAVLAFLAVIVGVAAHGAWTAAESSARILGFAIAAIFAVPLVMMLFALRRFLSRRYIVFDPSGVSILHGRQRVVVPWQEVAAIGIGYEQAPDEPTKIPTSTDDLKDMAKDYLAGKASEALHVSGERRLALEIFPVRPDAPRWFPKLQPYWTQLPPPARGLPPYEWRFPLPPVMAIAHEVGRGAQTFQPQRWLGWFARPWSGSRK
jgi:hypothetical protein